MSHLELKKCSTSNNFMFFGAWDMVKYKLHLPSWYMTNIQDGLFYIHHLKKLFMLRENEYAHNAFNNCHRLLINMF